MQFLIVVLHYKNVAFSANEKRRKLQNRTEKISRTRYKKFDIVLQKFETKNENVVRCIC